MSTTLVDVGRQVWRGALLMVDYLLTVGCHRVKDSVVLELGAGTGLVSTVAASRAKHTFCTGHLLHKMSSIRYSFMCNLKAALNYGPNYIPNVCVVCCVSQTQGSRCWSCAREILRPTLALKGATVET